MFKFLFNLFSVKKDLETKPNEPVETIHWATPAVPSVPLKDEPKAEAVIEVVKLVEPPAPKPAPKPKSKPAPKKPRKPKATK